MLAPSKHSIDPADTAGFFRLLYRDESPGVVALNYQAPTWKSPGRRPRMLTEFVAANDLDRAAERCGDLASEFNVWANVALLEKPVDGRGEANDAFVLPGVFADWDFQTPQNSAAKNATLPRDAAEAMSVAVELGLPPTFYVLTGHGTQPYWLFREPLILRSAADRQAAKALLDRVKLSVARIAGGRGWKFDAVQDLARMLRVVGTSNRKYEGEALPVTITGVNTSALYAPTDLAAKLDPLPSDKPRATPGIAVIFNDDAPAAPAPLSDRDLIERAIRARGGDKFRRLLEGDADDHGGDKSRADLAFANLLAFWTGRDAKRMDALFRLSRLMRPKWDERHYANGESYGQRTIGIAVRDCRNVYKGNGQHPPAWITDESFIAAKVKIEDAVARAEATKQAGVPFESEVVEALASLPESDRVNAVERFKAAIGKSFKGRALSDAVHAAGREMRRKARGKDLPRIVCGQQLRDQSIPSLEILAKSNDPPTLFIRSGKLVRVAVDEDGKHSIAEVTESYLRGELTRRADFFLETPRGLRDIAPPLEIVRDILGRDPNKELPLEGPAIPPLKAIVATPVMRADGSILNEPGYDQASGLFYSPSAGLECPPIPERPSHADVTAGVALLDEMIGDFPYGEQADKANALAGVIEPFIRQTVNASPIHLIDAPSAGTGKSLLARATHALAVGRDGVMTSFPGTEEERRKAITATLLRGSTFVIFDNLTATVDSAALATAITAAFWSDRLLGSLNNAEVPNVASWILTGNNVHLGGDLPRRCYRTRLDSKTARPWADDRTFRHPGLIDWIIENRGRLIAAVLTLCRAWHVAGRPAGDAKPLGSFESWTHTVGGVLKTAGVTGFMANNAELYDAVDEEASAWAAFLGAWVDTFGDKPKSLSEIEQAIPFEEALRDALPVEFAEMVKRIPTGAARDFTITEPGKFKIRLGKAMKVRAGRRFGPRELFISRSNDTHAKVATWRVESAGSAGCGGSVHSQACGDLSSTVKNNPMEVGGGHSRHSPHSPHSPQAAEADRSASEMEAEVDDVAPF